jgi:hypothetical protein
MCFLLVNLYEFGQFLRIFLWIFLPMMTIVMLVTTYFHYRRKREPQDGILLTVDGYSFATGDPAQELSGEKWETAAPVSTGPEVDDPTYIHNENMYRGILWMKEKYEQYRDLADKRYEELREELDRTEKRYQDLLATLEDNRARGVEGGAPAAAGTNGMPAAAEIYGKSEDGGNGDAERIALLPGNDMERESIRDIVEEKNRQIDFLQHQLEQRIKNYHQLEYQGRDYRARLEELEKQAESTPQALEERQRIIDEQKRIIDEQNGRLDEIEGSLQTERNKVEELVGKLQANSLLLMNIYKELDKSLNVEHPA